MKVQKKRQSEVTAMKSRGVNTKYWILMPALLFMAGCSSFFAAEKEVYTGLVEDDIIRLTDAGLSPRLIIKKIETSHSQFRLRDEDIIRLERESVDDDVIKAMIATDPDSREAVIEMTRSRHELWHNYYNTYYPLTLRFNRYYPIMYHSYGPYRTSRYKWSGELGLYMRDLPVGTSEWLYGHYPGFPKTMPLKEKSADEKEGVDRAP